MTLSTRCALSGLSPLHSHKGCAIRRRQREDHRVTGTRGHLVLREAVIHGVQKDKSAFHWSVLQQWVLQGRRRLTAAEVEAAEREKGSNKNPQPRGSRLSLWLQEAFPETLGRKNVCFSRKLDIAYSIPFLQDLKAEPMGSIRQLWDAWGSEAALTCKGILPGGRVALLLVEKSSCLSLHLHFNIPLLGKFFLYLIPYHL